MAKIKNPPKRSTKGNPPVESGSNLDRKNSQDLVNLNFKMTLEFRREFKGYANDRDITIKELLQRCFEFYKENHK